MVRALNCQLRWVEFRALTTPTMVTRCPVFDRPVRFLAICLSKIRRTNGTSICLVLVLLAANCTTTTNCFLDTGLYWFDFVNLMLVMYLVTATIVTVNLSKLVIYLPNCLPCLTFKPRRYWCIYYLKPEPENSINWTKQHKNQNVPNSILLHHRPRLLVSEWVEFNAPLDTI